MANGLVTAAQFKTAPDLLGGLRRGIGFGVELQQIAQQQQALERQRQIQELLGGVGQVAPQPAQLAPQPAELAPIPAEQVGIEGAPPAEAPPSPIPSEAERMRQAMRIDPAIAKQQFELMGMDSASRRAEASRFAARLQTLPPRFQDQEILSRAEKLRAEGRNPSDTLQLLDMNPAERSTALEGVQLMDLATPERIKHTQKVAADVGRIGTYNPRDYTTPSWAEFARTRNPAVLKRYSEKTLTIGGVPHRLIEGTTNQYEPIKTAKEVADNKALIEETVTAARAQAKVDVEKKVAELGAGKNLDDAIGVYNQLKDAELDKIYGFGETLVPDVIRSPSGVLMQANVDRLIAMLQLAGRGQLKGQGTITDAEQAVVANAATVLGTPNIPPEAAKEALNEAMQILFRGAGKEFVPPGPAAPPQQIGRFTVRVKQ
jgi:hypothetical protein